MKISNNALNFILAQYRAIFKRAYVKGLASAVLLTAGLAAGQAQAADPLTSIDNGLSGTIVIGKTIGDVEATNSAINLKSKDVGQINGKNKWNANVTVNSGALSTGNYIQVSGGAAVNITGTGALTINLDSTAGAANAGGVSFIGNGTSADADLTFDINKIDVVNGTMNVKATTSGSVTVAADNITIGNTASNPSGTGIVKLSATTAANNAILGVTDSVIAINKGGQVQLSGGSAGATEVNGLSLNVLGGGVFHVTDGTSNVNVVDLNVDKDSYLLVTKGTNATSATFAGKTATVDGKVLVASGASLTINTVEANDDETDIEGQGIVTLSATSNTQIGGTLTVKQGTLDVKAEVNKLHASNAGAIKVVDSTADDGNVSTLKINSKVLDAFLKGNNSVLTISNTGATSNGTSAAGAVVLSGSANNTEATLEFTDKDTVIILSDFVFSGTGSAKTGKIDVKSGTIAGNDLQVKTALTNAAGLHLRANTLRLGSATYTSTGEDLKIADAVAKDLILTSNSTGFGVKNAITLDVTLGDDTITVTDANGKGVIKGSPVLTDNTKALTHIWHQSCRFSWKLRSGQVT